MGYFRDDRPGHEGYAVGFVVRDGVEPGNELLRELEYPRDNETRHVVAIAAGCDCGWRSPRFKPRPGTTWGPYSVDTRRDDDDRVHKLWSEHAEGCR